MLGLVGVVVAVSVATWLLFLSPSTDQPSKVDAIVALGGDPGQLRAKLALDLAREGYASVVLVSLGGATPAPCPHPEAHVRIVCFRADPLNTRGEAEYAARMARRHHWNRVMVVPSTTQVTRARLEFSRCTGATLVMVPEPDPRSALGYDVLYEWAALAKSVLVVRAC